MKIPFHKPIMPKNINDIFTESILDGWLTTGPEVNKFERKLEEYLNIDHVVAVNSCTAALHLVLAAKGFTNSDKFIVPTYTFVASVEVGEYLNMKPILIDSKENCFNVDLNKVEDVLKNDSSVKAIIPVHFAGKLVHDRNQLQYLADKYNVFILEDAAHALESISSSRGLNNNTAVALSFYANKNITTGGEGGAIATFDKELAKKVRMLSLHGMSKDGWDRFKLGGKWRYDVSGLGYKYNMTDISASFGQQQLKKINNWHTKRINIVSQYSDSLRECDGIICPSLDIQNHSWHLYIIQIHPEMWRISRNEIIYNLNSLGIGTSVHYIPVHMHSYYQRKYGFQDNDYPNAKRFSETVISLPLYPLLKIKEINYITDVLKNLWNKFKS